MIDSRVLTLQRRRDRYRDLATHARWGWLRRWYASCAEGCERQRRGALLGRGRRFECPVPVRDVRRDDS